MELISRTDDFLIDSIASNITLTYIILFAIIFSESGIIIFPFLPGDGLLFSIGVVATFTPLNLYIAIPLLILAAILGFLLNYKLGAIFGKWVIQKNIPFVKKSFHKTAVFMTNHGSSAVIFSRFFPIVRTYLPFIAGMVKMNFKDFYKKTILGAFLWVLLFVFTGYFTGEIPWVKENYGIIFLGLIVVSIVPLFVQLIKNLFMKRN